MVIFLGYVSLPEIKTILIMRRSPQLSPGQIPAPHGSSWRTWAMKPWKFSARMTIAMAGWKSQPFHKNTMFNTNWWFSSKPGWIHTGRWLSFTCPTIYIYDMIIYDVYTIFCPLHTISVALIWIVFLNVSYHQFVRCESRARRYSGSTDSSGNSRWKAKDLRSHHSW